MDCHTPGCTKPGAHQGYCREHAEYLSEHTTLMLSPAAKVGRVVLALVLAATLVLACRFLPRNCEPHAQFYLRGTGAECPK